MMLCVEPFQVRAACDDYEMDLTDEELDQFMSCMEQEGRVPEARGPVFEARMPPRSECTSASNSAESGSVSAGLAPQLPSDLKDNWQQIQGSHAVQNSAELLSNQRAAEGAVRGPITAGMAPPARPCHSSGPSWTNLQLCSSFSAGEATAANVAHMGAPAGDTQRACNTHSSFTESPAARTQCAQSGMPQVCWESADDLLASRVGSNTWDLTSVGLNSCNAYCSPEGTVPRPSSGPITAPSAYGPGPLTEPASVLQQQLENWQLLQTAESSTWPPAASVGTAATATVPAVSAAQSYHTATPAGTPASSPVGAGAEISAMALPSVESVLAAARLPSGNSVNGYPGGGTAVTPAVTPPPAASIPTADGSFRKQPRNTSPRANKGGTRNTADCSRTPNQLQRFEDLVMQMFLQQRSSMGKSQEQGQLHKQDSQRSNHQQQWQGGDSQQISNGSVMPEAYGAVAGQSDLAAPGAIDHLPATPASGSSAPSASLFHQQYSDSAGGSPKIDTTVRRIFPMNTSPSKLQPSHSTIEKQRRDRLNTLIEELATLVPPSDTRYEKSASSRRPKHIVLADAINLIRAMHLKFQMGRSSKITTAAVADLSTAGAVGGLSVAGDLAPHTNGSALVLQGTPVAEVPDVDLSSGVTIEYSSYGTMVVKVGCRDRFGLLSDVLDTLKAVPVAIVAANATIGDDGMAHGTFEVRTQDMATTPDHLYQLVHNTVFPNGTPRTKRLRQLEWQ